MHGSLNAVVQKLRQEGVRGVNFKLECPADDEFYNIACLDRWASLAYARLQLPDLISSLDFSTISAEDINYFDFCLSLSIAAPSVENASPDHVQVTPAGKLEGASKTKSKSSHNRQALSPAVFWSTADGRNQT